MTQSQMILRHLRDSGSITQMDAMQDYGIMRLASRINDLRRDGHPIVTEWAAEHPEPVTWWDWFAARGLDPDDPIPADIAQKLGIEPVGINAKKRMKDIVCGGDGFGAE